jgi:hypothetical protein
MKPMTLRDQWLASALPALLTLLFGWLIVLRPAQREVATLGQRVRNQGSLDDRKSLLTRVNADRVELERRVAERRVAAEAHGTICDSNAAMRHVSELCKENGLVLKKFEPDPSGKLPPTLQQAATAVGSLQPQTWRIELDGDYPAVTQLLEGLPKASALIVPLNLTMTTGNSQKAPPAWVITLWL